MNKSTPDRRQEMPRILNRARRICLGLALAAILTLGLPFQPHALANTRAVDARVVASVVTTQRIVALTFDDGPSPYTAQVLAVLKHFDASATFFLIGRQIAPFRDIVKAEVDAGHELGNHTFTHANLLWLSNAQVEAQLADTQAAARGAANVTPRWFRPPYGAVSSRVALLAANLGLRTVIWSVDPKDWTRPGVGAIVVRVLSAVRPGSIVIMHDGGGDRLETVLALPLILSSLKSQGYKFVTLDTLFNEPLPHPCDVAGGMRWFSSAGIALRPEHQIYRTWQDLYCQGENLGPATSSEYRVSPTTVAQNFAHTGHRIEWDARSGESRVFIVWPFATSAFAGRGIFPQWHTPITTSWFDQYFQGQDWGPALSPAIRFQDTTSQHFQYGWAIERAGKVAWKK